MRISKHKYCDSVFEWRGETLAVGFKCRGRGTQFNRHGEKECRARPSIGDGGEREWPTCSALSCYNVAKQPAKVLEKVTRLKQANASPASSPRGGGHGIAIATMAGLCVVKTIAAAG